MALSSTRSSWHLSPERQRRLSRKSSDRVVYRNGATNAARKVRGTIEGSINVDIYSVTTN
jgi:hypothetical protein